MDSSELKWLAEDTEISLGISDACNASTELLLDQSRDVIAGGSPAVAPMHVAQDDLSRFLARRPFVLAVTASRYVKKEVRENPLYAERFQQCVADAMSYSKAYLQKKYKHEYNSMRSRRQGAKDGHKAYDKRLKDFRDWLIHFGPRPAPGWTVHRVDNDKGYLHRSLKWATKLEPTRVRKVTKWHLVNGRRMTTKQLANHRGLSYQRTYGRLAAGWTIQRLLESCQKTKGISAWKFPAESAHELEPLYATRRRYDQNRLDWYIARLQKWIESPDDIPEEELVRLANALVQAEAERDAILVRQREEEAATRRKFLDAIAPSLIAGGKPSACMAMDDGLRTPSEPSSMPSVQLIAPPPAAVSEKSPTTVDNEERRCPIAKVDIKADGQQPAQAIQDTKDDPGPSPEEIQADLAYFAQRALGRRS